VGEILTKSYDIICRTGLHCAPKIFRCLGCGSTVRLSLSRFTTDEELDAVISAVKDITDEI
jgi:selenocysteine lyase/cysteine desulfurase